MLLVAANTKGGVGKTTVVVNLGAALHELGLRVGLVDLDRAGHLTTWLLRKPVPEPREVEGLVVLSAHPAVHEAILRGGTKHLRALPRSLGCDVVLVDTAPGQARITDCALAGGEGLLVPVTLDFLAVAGYRQLWQKVGGRIPLIGVVPNHVERRSRLGLDVLAWLDARTGPLLPPIPRSARLREAPLAGTSILSFAPQDRSAHAFRLLAQEVRDRVEKGLYVRPRL